MAKPVFVLLLAMSLAAAFLLFGCTSPTQDAGPRTFTPVDEFPTVIGKGNGSSSNGGAAGNDVGNVSVLGPAFTLHVLYFYGGTCPYSAKATPTVNELNLTYGTKNVIFHYYEVWYDEPNRELYNRIADVYGIREDNRGVPVVFIDGEYLMGYQRVNQYLEQEINVCLEAHCPNPLDSLTNASIAKPI